jgi:D-lyxose ketol-isomerase
VRRPKQEWKGRECGAIVDQQLGWDIKDFESGDFRRIGLLVFTHRNGHFAKLEKPMGRTDAEKILIVQQEQVTPT